MRGRPRRVRVGRDARDEVVVRVRGRVVGLDRDPLRRPERGFGFAAVGAGITRHRDVVRRRGDAADAEAPRLPDDVDVAAPSMADVGSSEVRMPCATCASPSCSGGSASPPRVGPAVVRGPPAHAVDLHRDDHAAADRARSRARRRRLDERDAADVAGVARPAVPARWRRARPVTWSRDERRGEGRCRCPSRRRCRRARPCTVSWLPPLWSTSTLIVRSLTWRRSHARAASGAVRVTPVPVAPAVPTVRIVARLGACSGVDVDRAGRPA